MLRRLSKTAIRSRKLIWLVCSLAFALTPRTAVCEWVHHHHPNPGGMATAQNVITSNFIQTQTLNTAAEALAHDPLNSNLRNSYQTSLTNSANQHTDLINQFNIGNLADSNSGILNNLGSLVNTSPSEMKDPLGSTLGLGGKLNFNEALQSASQGGDPTGNELSQPTPLAQPTLGTESSVPSTLPSSSGDSKVAVSSPSNGTAGVQNLGDGTFLMVRIGGGGGEPAAAETPPTPTGENEKRTAPRPNQDFFDMVSGEEMGPNNPTSRGTGEETSVEPNKAGTVPPSATPRIAGAKPFVLVGGEWKAREPSSTGNKLNQNNGPSGEAPYVDPTLKAGAGSGSESGLDPFSLLKILSTILAASLCIQLILWFRSTATKKNLGVSHPQFANLTELIKDNQVLALESPSEKPASQGAQERGPQTFVGFDPVQRQWTILKTVDKNGALEKVGILRPGSVVSARRLQGDKSLYHFKLTPDGGWSPTKDKEGFLISVKNQPSRKKSS